MRALGRCGGVYRTLYANRRLGPALFGLTPGCSLGVPYTSYQNDNTAVKVTAAHHRHFSASAWHNSGGRKKTKRAKASRGPKRKIPRRYQWASRKVSEDVYDVLESHIPDSARLASENFPVPDTVDLSDDEYEMPPDPDDIDDPYPPRYKALAIDCEMVAMRHREQGLLSIGVVDFFTGKVVLRSLVRPSGGVTDWRREFTGMSKPRLKEAIKKRKVLSGWDEVRERIFGVTTSETIFIGHALANDLRVLRIATDRVVDSMIMTSHAVFGDVDKFPRNWSLKNACRELLDVEVQKKRIPHSPLEDAYATRELVLQCVLNPEKLAEWGRRIRTNMEQIVQKKRDKEKEKMEKKRLRKAEKANRSPEQIAQEAAERKRKQQERQEAKAALEEAKAERRKHMRQLKQAKKREKRRKRAEALQERGEERRSKEIVAQD
ncbi:ribonuclease H-like domain-containing protein [Xylaria telfairii]|nr:ribonuclease H-like domain-containing protein [Xylaria telfairii]